MAYAFTDTGSNHLSLVSSSESSGGAEAVRLEPSNRLQNFVETAAQAGLAPAEAVEMAIERALALADGARLCGDIELARRRLSLAADAARPRRGTSPEQASRVRRLTTARSLEAADVGEGLVVPLPACRLSRAADVHESYIHADIVSEMVAWEVAAVLEGRTVGEWALWTLGSSRAAAA